jgi:hypothetical protein
VTPGSTLTAYWRFHRAVATAQLASWLPAGHQLILDISGPHARSAGQAARAGHRVLRVVPTPDEDGEAPPGWAAGPPSGQAGGPPPAPAGRRPPGQLGGPPRGRYGSVTTVTADPGSLRFLADGSVDGVIADDRTLSRYIAAEYLAAEISRVLRPGGRLLATADSLVLGMAILAEQRHWAELTDMTSAEVLLIPWPDGTFTRCYGAQHLRDLCAEAGLKASLVRPRTVLSPSMVNRVLDRDPNAMARLVQAELTAEADESFGIQLVMTARKPS